MTDLGLSFSDIEVTEISRLVKRSEQNNDFRYDNDWIVEDVLKDSSQNPRILDIKLLNATGHCVILQLKAGDFPQVQPNPANESPLSNRAFAVSIVLMEFANIFDLDSFDDGLIVNPAYELDHGTRN